MQTPDSQQLAAEVAWADKIAKLEFLHAETQQYFHMAYVRVLK